MVDLPDAMLDLPDTMLDLLDTMVDLSDTMVDLHETMVDLPDSFSPQNSNLPNSRFAKLPSPAIDWKIWKALYSRGCFYSFEFFILS